MAESAKEILIVDDDPDMVGTVYDVLAGEGYAVTCAHNGAEALQYLGMASRALGFFQDANQAYEESIHSDSHRV